MFFLYLIYLGWCYLAANQNTAQIITNSWQEPFFTRENSARLKILKNNQVQSEAKSTWTCEQWGLCLIWTICFKILDIYVQLQIPTSFFWDLFNLILERSCRDLFLFGWNITIEARCSCLAQTTALRGYCSRNALLILLFLLLLLWWGLSANTLKVMIQI